MNLKPYPEYKPSGVSWLGDVPKHWVISRIKNHIKEVDIRSKYGTEMLLSMTRLRGIIPFSERSEKPASAKTLIGYKICHSGQMVMNKMQAWSGMFFASTETGIISPDYTIFDISSNDDVSFFGFLFQSPIMVEQFKIESKGIGSGFNRLYTDRFGFINIALPDKSEQMTISNFIRFKTSLIARFIKAKKRMIELLKEQKQVVINDAVTGKIDVQTGKPYPKYKDSGVEWLGMVPEEWKILSLRRVTFYVKTGGTPKGAEEKYFEENGFNWYTPGDFNDEVSLKNAKRKLSKLGIENVTVFPPKSVLMIGIGATIGKAAISPFESSCNQQINALVVNNRMIPEYMVLSLRMMKHFIISCGKYTTLPIINQDETKMLRIRVPSVIEQEKIVENVKKQTISINLIISRIEREITLVQEYRTRLIADVVTGKVDVRNISVPCDYSVEEEFNAEDANEVEVENG